MMNLVVQPEVAYIEKRPEFGAVEPIRGTLFEPVVKPIDNDFETEEVYELLWNQLRKVEHERR